MCLSSLPLAVLGEGDTVLVTGTKKADASPAGLSATTCAKSEGKTIQLYKAVVDKDEQGEWKFAAGDKVDITAAYSVSTNKDGSKTVTPYVKGGTAEAPLYYMAGAMLINRKKWFCR